MINVHDIEPSSNIYGPGKRMVIWVQGCLLRCKGCWNTKMWPMEPKELYSVRQLVERVKANPYGIEGITLIGGEPMHQSQELVRLVQQIAQSGFSTVLFTGYNYEELQLDSQKTLWNMSDIIICGRYIEEKRNIYLQWRGSENQQVIFNSDKYCGYRVDEGNYIEICIEEDGEMSISGFPSFEID